MTVLEIKDKVQRWLMDMGLHGIEVIPDGFTFRLGSTRVFMRVLEYGESENAFTVASIYAPMVLDAKASPELFEYVAKHADDRIFGHLGLFEEEDGTMTITYNYSVLADFLDPEELKHAVGAVAGTADDIDNELAAQFSGRVFHED